MLLGKMKTRWYCSISRHHLCKVLKFQIMWSHTPLVGRFACRITDTLHHCFASVHERSLDSAWVPTGPISDRRKPFMVPLKVSVDRFSGAVSPRNGASPPHMICISSIATNKQPWRSLSDTIWPSGTLRVTFILFMSQMQNTSGGRWMHRLFTCSAFLYVIEFVLILIFTCIPDDRGSSAGHMGGEHDKTLSNYMTDGQIRTLQFASVFVSLMISILGLYTLAHIAGTRARQEESKHQILEDDSDDDVPLGDMGSEHVGGILLETMSGISQAVSEEVTK